jgi:hypothetical protein
MKMNEATIKTTADTTFPQILLFTMYIPDNELTIQWNKTQSQTLWEVFLMLAKAKLNPNTLIPKAKKFCPYWDTP